MPAKVVNNIKLVVIVSGFFVTIFTGGVGYGQMSNRADKLEQDVKIHCANQVQNEKDLSRVLMQLSEANAALSNEVKNLKESVTELKQEIRRIR